MSSQVNTHHGINRELCGRPVELSEGGATVSLSTTAAMAADDHGLVHGGFVFGLADYAAMLAVNDPLVVLGSANVTLTAPVMVGDEVLATAKRTELKGRKHVIDVSAAVGETVVMKGVMTAFVLDEHVLSKRQAEDGMKRGNA